MKSSVVMFQAGLLIIFTGMLSCAKNSNGNPDPGDSDTLVVPVQTLRSDLNYPWEILWGKDDHIWMTERNGKVSKVNPADGSAVFNFTIDEVEARGEGGLLGMAQDPEFLSTGFLYVVYNYLKSGTYTEKLVRFKVNNNSLIEPQILLDDIPAANIHNGSRIWITEGGDPKIFLSTGDAANSSSALNQNSLSGKILRLNKDGSVPADNPVPGNPIWSFGHRNPQGMVMVQNVLYTAEHGQNIEDEVNIIQKGKNFGWPNVEGPCNGGETAFCNTNGVAEPIWSTGSSTFALSGMDYYNNDLIPEWKNSLLVASLKNTTLYALKLNDARTTVTGASEFFDGKYGRLRDLCISPGGVVYICTSNGGNNDVLLAVRKSGN